METLAYIYCCLAREAPEASRSQQPEQLNRSIWPPSGNVKWLRLVSTLICAASLIWLNLIWTASARILRRGMVGYDIEVVQDLLNQQGYYIYYGPMGGGKGKFGSQTQSQVMKFQADKKLTVDGVVGPQTMSVLRGNEVVMARILSRGMRGSDIAEVQDLLNERGYVIEYTSNKASRGYFDLRTETALLRYQTEKANLQPIGVVNAATLKTLREDRTNIDERPYVATQYSPLNIRSGPGMQFARIGQLAKGTRVEIFLSQGAWHRIPQGWVSARYVAVPEAKGVAEKIAALWEWVEPFAQNPEQVTAEFCNDLKTNNAETVEAIRVATPWVTYAGVFLFLKDRKLASGSRDFLKRAINQCFGTVV